jgi:hypothetical protein
LLNLDVLLVDGLHISDSVSIFPLAAHERSGDSRWRAFAPTSPRPFQRQLSVVRHLYFSDKSIADLIDPPQKSLSTAFGQIKGKAVITAPAAATLVSDQDYSLQPNRHIINTLPPPVAAVY